MGQIIQYNPSTGKASYSQETGKTQTIIEIPCEHCEVTPSFVSVTLAGVTSRAGCVNTVAGDRRYENIPDINGSYQLTRIDAVSLPCSWRVFIEIPTATITFYSSNNGSCTGETGSQTKTTLVLIVNKLSATRAFLDVSLDLTSKLFRATEPSGYIPTSSCLSIVNVDNDIVASDTNRFAYGGTATVVDL